MIKRDLFLRWFQFVGYTSCQVCSSILPGLIQSCFILRIPFYKNYEPSVSTTESTPCANIKWIMPDTETHVEGVAQNPLSHLSLLPVNRRYLLFCKCKGIKAVMVYFTHFPDETFGFCVWIPLQDPSLSQLSLPQGGDISISPPCEELSNLFHKRFLLCQSAETPMSPNITFILLPKGLKKTQPPKDFKMSTTFASDIDPYPCQSAQFSSKLVAECL